jgi:hypothetical protein
MSALAPKVLIVMYDIDGLRRTRSKAQGDVSVTNVVFKEEHDEWTYYFTSSLHSEPVAYVVDSVYFGNFNTDECHAHAIAGLTCSNTRYIYNGWKRQTVAGGSKGKRLDIPCNLMPWNWWSQQLPFCTDQVACKIYGARSSAQKKPPRRRADHCFDPRRGSRVHFAVRKDLYQKGQAYDEELAALKTWGVKVQTSSTRAYNPATKSEMSVELSEYNKYMTVNRAASSPPSEARGRKTRPGFFSMLCGGLS